MTEPSEDFDWRALDDPIGQIMEEFKAVGISQHQAQAMLWWAEQRGIVSNGMIMQRIGLWLLGGIKDNDRDIALRCRVYGGKYALAARHAMPIRSLARVLKVSKGEIDRIRRNMEENLFGGNG